MQRLMTTAIVLFFMLFINLAAVSANDAPVSEQDKEFVKKAAMGSMLEVQLGKIAQEKAASQDVKDFGQRMVNDHSQANDKLKEIAKEIHVSLPKELDKKHQRTIDKLSQLSGEEFDREYMNNMVKDHRKDIETFEKEVRQGQNTQVQQFASQTLEKLQEHKQIAMNVDQQMSQRAEGQGKSQMQASKVKAGDAKNWIGQKVTGKNGEMLGTVKNNYLSQDKKSVVYVIVQGEQDRMHPIPVHMIRQNEAKDELTAGLDKKTFDQSPGFGQTEKPELDQASWSQEIRSYYQQPQQSGQPKK